MDISKLHSLLLRFHLCVDAVSPSTISKMESLATRYLKKWLQLPRSSTRVILYYPGICCPSVTYISREAKLNLLSCISSSSDPQLHELGIHLGQSFLQVRKNDYSILMAAKEQLSALPSARSLYLKAKSRLLNDTKSTCQSHLQTLSVQSKFEDSAKLETTCRTWNRLLSGLHPGQLSFILRASSDTLPTEVNLCRWNIQCGAKCALCDSPRPTTAHVLSGCPVALSQHRYTYRHDSVLYVLVTGLVDMFADLPNVKVFADLQNFRSCESPPATIPTTIMVTAYRPDIVVFNTDTSAVALLELTCPLDSSHHLEAARSRKQSKVEYHQILAELDRLEYPNYYETLEVSVLGHYQRFSVKNILNLLDFIQPDLLLARVAVQKMLDMAAKRCISASQRIFMAKKCSEWFSPDIN